MSPTFVFQWSLFFFFILSISAAAKRFNIPRLSPIGPRTRLKDPEISSESLISDGLETFSYSQTIDHFNYQPESYETFEQRYVISSKYWGGSANNNNSNAPILVYFGAEAPIDGDLSGIGFLSDNAIKFNALLIYIEHRFYGKSIPFGMTQEEAVKNENTRGYFNSAQAIADYAEIILHIKENFNAQNSPVIVIGGSYGGMLAAWFRLKYPHIALGALASSAPVLSFDNITPPDAYYSVVSKVFKEASETCYQTIKKSWEEIDQVANSNGLSILSNKFKTCRPLTDGDELKSYLISMYGYAAQYNQPPDYPVNMVCNGIDGSNDSSENDTLSKIFGGVVAYEGNMACYVNAPTYVSENMNAPTSYSETAVGWAWQTCSEMVITIFGRGNDSDSMFQAHPFDLNALIQGCNSHYGVPPRPHWVTTYYGGHNIKLVLQRFGSNIIFSNGLGDPYSAGGVLTNISDTVLAVYTTNGSHCLDILTANETTDPEWLVQQRNTEINIIQQWINKYYDDLQNL